MNETTVTDLWASERDGFRTIFYQDTDDVSGSV
jgi:hypothetical protein